MEGSRVLQIFFFKLLQYYGPLRRSPSVKFSTVMFYLVIVFSSLFSGFFIRGVYGFSEMSEKELVNVISITFSSVIAMGVFLGLKGGITALGPEIDFVLTSPIRPSTYLVADLLFQFFFLNFAVTPPLISFMAVMLYPRLNALPAVFLSYEMMLFASSAIAQILGVLKSIVKEVGVEAAGWVILLTLFMPLVSMTMGLGVNYSDLPYPSTLLAKFSLGSLGTLETAIWFAYLILILGSYSAVMRINFLPNVTPLLTTALMEMPSSNRRILRWVPRIFTQILSPKMSEKPMALVVKLNLLRILRDGSLFTAIMLFAIATLANLSFPILVRQFRFFALAALTFSILYTPLIPAIFSINWGIIERETLWTVAVSEKGFRRYVKGMLVAYFIATFSFAVVFYSVFSILLAGTPFLVLDFLLILSVTLFSSILSVASALVLSKPSNALSLSALLYVFIPLFGAVFLSMPVILARTTISIADTPPPMIILILVSYTSLIAFLLSRYTLARSETFFGQPPVEEPFPTVSQRLETQNPIDYRSYILNFSTLASSILLVVSLVGISLGKPEAVSLGRSESERWVYGLPLAGLTSLVLAASILLQRKAVKQCGEKAVCEAPGKVPWKASQSFLMLVLAMFLPTVLELPFLAFSFSTGLAIDSLALLITGEFAMVIPVLLYMVGKKMSLRFLGLDSQSALQEYRIALLVLPLTVLTGFSAGVIVETLIPVPPWFEEVFKMLSPSSFVELVALSLITILVVAPCEEVLFRGFIQRGLESSFGSKWGILLSSILFGAFHLNPWQFLPAFLVGIILGYVFKKRGYRLWCPIALHAAYNVTLFVLNYVLRV
ncbi:MAG: CPBP family intramembrane metalloprotease [Candidatus Brockarchaeota archaeon]|nr:CPBP family intramembrane metalloprotease [Candidatus Brockarchaeota archaeon]